VVQARSPHYALLDITNMLFEEGNPAGIKMVLQELGVCESYVRQPLWAISEDLTSRICTATKALMD
jgi:4-hydroxy-tetrahydrodipicolinate synthase